MRDRRARYIIGLSMNTPKILASGARIDLKWGTFCKQILEEHDTSERSLIGIIPILVMTVELDLTAEAGTSQPSFFELPLPVLYVHSVFRRRERSTEILKPQIDLEFTFPGYEADVSGHKFKAAAGLVFGPDHEFGQLSVKIGNPKLRIPKTAGRHESQLTVRYSVSGEQLGEIILPTRVEIIEKSDGAESSN